MKNKKAQSEAGILLLILVFQAFVIISLGFLNITNDTDDITTTNYDSGLGDFVVNIITNIKLLGWGNTLLFAPLTITIIYIIARLIRGGG
jgi:hypothetical protein